MCVCWKSSVDTFHRFTGAAIAASPALVACNSAFATCEAACVAAVLMPTPWKLTKYSHTYCSTLLSSALIIYSYIVILVNVLAGSIFYFILIYGKQFVLSQNIQINIWLTFFSCKIYFIHWLNIIRKISCVWFKLHCVLTDLTNSIFGCVHLTEWVMRIKRKYTDKWIWFVCRHSLSLALKSHWVLSWCHSTWNLSIWLWNRSL